MSVAEKKLRGVLQCPYSSTAKGKRIKGEHRAARLREGRFLFLLFLERKSSSSLIRGRKGLSLREGNSPGWWGRGVRILSWRGEAPFLHEKEKSGCGARRKWGDWNYDFRREKRGGFSLAKEGVNLPFYISLLKEGKKENPLNGSR